MNYKDTLQAVDSEKALGLIGIEYHPQGAYLKFSCPQKDCDGISVIKTYGDKKNLYYCPKCKSSGHIISLVMLIKNVTWDEAKEILIKAKASDAKLITEELNIKYELQYCDFLKDKGITEEMCKSLEIGVPKGKTMLAGCVAFSVRDDAGMKVAYYGIRMKDGKPVFHKSFNPEFYVYNLCNVDQNGMVYFFTDIFECLKYNTHNTCICNFGMPYLSRTQLTLLQNVQQMVMVLPEDLVRPFAIQMAENQMNFHRFERR